MYCISTYKFMYLFVSVKLRRVSYIMYKYSNIKYSLTVVFLVRSFVPPSLQENLVILIVKYSSLCLVSCF